MGKIKYMRAKAHELRSKRTYTDKANTNQTDNKQQHSKSRHSVSTMCEGIDKCEAVTLTVKYD